MNKRVQSRKAQFDEDDLSRLILVDGKSVQVREATAEEFDIYIYHILGRAYRKKGHVLQRYALSFDYDWKYLGCRVLALNELHKLNLARRSTRPPRPEIALFIEEEEQVRE